MPSLVLVDLDMIDPDPDNPRGPDVGDVTDLKLSIARCGLQEALQLIPKAGGRWKIHEGHRRVKALRELGEQRAPAVPRHFRTDLEQILSQGTIHTHRSDWKPMAWARYVRRLWRDENLKTEQIALHLGRSTNWVKDRLALNHLHVHEQRALDAGEITLREALHRLATRRAARDGTAPPAPLKAGNTGPAGPAGKVPAQRRRRVAEPHLNADHRLAEQVAARCASGGLEHAARPKIGGVGCGHCWEDVIRADALTTAPDQPVLAAA